MKTFIILTCRFISMACIVLVFKAMYEMTKATPSILLFIFCAAISWEVADRIQL